MSSYEEWKHLEDSKFPKRELMFPGWRAQQVLQATSPEAFESATQCIKCDFVAKAGTDQADADADANVLIDSVHVEKLGIHGEGASSAVPPSATAQTLLTSLLISLDLTGTQLGDDALGSIASWAPWVRELRLTGAHAWN